MRNDLKQPSSRRLAAAAFAKRRSRGISSILCLIAMAGTMALHAQILLDGSFEQTPAGGYCPYGNSLIYGPAGTPWQFILQCRGRGLPRQRDLPAGDAPAGRQPSGVSATRWHSISQNITLPASGEYALAYYVEGRWSADPDGGALSYQVTLDSSVIANDSTTNYQAWTPKSYTFSATAGTHTLAFTGVSVPPGRSTDQTAMLDAVAITSVPEPGAGAMLAAGSLLGLALGRRRLRPDPLTRNQVGSRL